MIEELNVEGGGPTTYVKWKVANEGDMWEGNYVSKRPGTKYPGSFTYFLKNGDNQVGIPSCTTLKKIFDSVVQVGDWVTITFQGRRPSNKGQDQIVLKVTRDTERKVADGAKPATVATGVPF